MITYPDLPPTSRSIFSPLLCLPPPSKICKDWSMSGLCSELSLFRIYKFISKVFPWIQKFIYGYSPSLNLQSRFHLWTPGSCFWLTLWHFHLDVNRHFQFMTKTKFFLSPQILFLPSLSYVSSCSVKDLGVILGLTLFLPSPAPITLPLNLQTSVTHHI